MNITTLDKDIARVKKLLESRNKKGIDTMLELFHEKYICQITSRLDPFEQKIYIDMFS